VNNRKKQVVNEWDWQRAHNMATNSPVKTHDSYYKMHEWITTDLKSYNMSRVTMYINLKRCLLTKSVT
jgi:hypothetical protein